MTSTHDTLERYQELPISGVASNEPYAVGPEKAEADKRQTARDEFIENGVDWPELNFPMLNAEDLKSAERSLTTLLMDIIADPDTEGAVKDIAYEQIALKLAEVYRHLEVVRGLGSVAVAKRELSRDRAGSMTMEIFGEPRKDVFDQLIAEERRANLEQLHSSDPVVAQTAREYLTLTGAVEASIGTSGSSFELETETGEVVLQDLKEMFPGLDEFLDQAVEQPVSPEESLAYFDQVLSLAGLTEKGWKTELSEGRAVGTDGPTKRILVGGKRAAFSPTAIKGVPVHEAIVHALRYQNAIEQEEPLKRRALPGNLNMEEGLGTSLEQIVTGERRVAGKPYYISLGLQLNLDHPGESKRDFHQTHEIMWRRSLLERKNGSSGETTETEVRKAKEDAYQTVIRTTRGNSLDARDISYFEGGRKANKWLNEIAKLPKEERQKKLRWVFSGKFDPTNEIHAKLFDEAVETH
jgi:hypothetical protein